MLSSPSAEKLRRRKWPLIAAAGATVAVLGAGAAVAGYAYAGDVPRGTTVLGVEIGGLSRSDAATRLRDAVADRESLAAPVKVRIGDRDGSIQPQDVGLAVDVEATVDRAARPSFRLWGTHEVAPTVMVDETRLDAALRPQAQSIAHAVKTPGITYDGLTPVPTYAAPGKGIDLPRSADAVKTSWLAGNVAVVPLVDIEPATTRADVDRLVAELAEPAVAGPVTVNTPRGTVQVKPAAIAKSLKMTGDTAGRITPRVDPGALRSALGTALSKVEKKPQEARVRGNRVVASTGGQMVDTERLATDLLAVLPKAPPRAVTAVMKTVEPKTTDAELAALGIKERVSTFTTYFTGGLSSPRTKNIIQAAKEVDGAIVEPGETFSLNGHTGPRGYKEGYHDAPVIVDGKLTPGVGGGISQFTTTLFNASYYAGLEDVEHKPHSYYFSRYPSVIESTIFYPSLDLKFRNNTEHGVLIDTSYTKDSITVSMWSTKVYDSVKTTWSERRDITQPRAITLKDGPECIATEGIEGFTQDAWRIIRKDGKEIKREKFTWRYEAEPRYTCGEPEKRG
jgi:vancomycin resistance protein YoaR